MDTPSRSVARRRPVGAEIVSDGRVHFRVWAPRRRSVSVVIESDGARPIALASEADGYFAGTAPARAGDRYRFLLDDDATRYPDPASRFQPDGPHGPSQIVDPNAFAWTDAAWKGVSLPGQVLYEMHVGTFTREGTFDAAARELAALRALGITVVEVMPLADFPGRFGWGYDGVNLFAPTRLYGDVDALRRFVDRAHALGLGVILDVVYNHLGPDGNYLGAFSDHFFSTRYPKEWGDPINFDDAESGPVRAFYVANAGYWIDEFHLDGLRLDATQSIFDASPRHVIAEIVEAVRANARGRETLVVCENEPQDVRIVEALSRGGYGADGLWNDDFHHTAMVSLTGRAEGYYADYRGTPQEFVSAIKHGYLFQGQWYRWQKKPRGTPSFDVAPRAFVTYLQNHDQIANAGRGRRIHDLASPSVLRAVTALWLLSPGTPMLFQGQEFAASAPFLYFADHVPELAALVGKGRREFVHQFASVASAEMAEYFAEPNAEATFTQCRLDHGERAKHAEAYALHHDLLALRRDDPVVRAQGEHGLDGAVLSDRALAIRLYGPTHDEDRLILTNLGADLALSPIPEPLVAPPRGREWSVRFASEWPRYGGEGVPAMRFDDEMKLSGGCTLLLVPVVHQDEGDDE